MALLVWSCIALLGSGCATSSPDDGQQATELYQVTAENTPFYRMGPQQPAGPDLSLEKGRVVKMLKRSYGYSRIELDNTWAGYVATEDLEPAPEGASLNPERDDFSSNSAIVERYYTNDTPLPELSEEDFDLGTGVNPPPDTEPLELPKFRY